MTSETMYSHICAMLQEYDLHTGHRAADGVISNPEKWIDAANYFPFYASAAALLLEVDGAGHTNQAGHRADADVDAAGNHNQAHTAGQNDEGSIVI